MRSENNVWADACPSSAHHTNCREWGRNYFNRIGNFPVASTTRLSSRHYIQSGAGLLLLREEAVGFEALEEGDGCLGLVEDVEVDAGSTCFQ